MAMHRLLLADDSERCGLPLKSLLQQLAPEWEVCGETPEAEEAVQMAEELRPDVILIDLSISGSKGSCPMPRSRNFNALRRLSEWRAWSDVQVLPSAQRR
jgi:DNA-binding NarL/FixJ family response regulator